MSKRSKYGWCLAGLVLAQVFASLFVPRPSFGLAAFSDVLQCGLLLWATLPYIPNALKTSGRTRLFWILMSLGLGSWLSYGFLWTYIEVVQRRVVPDLYIGDAVLFLHFVPMMAALALQPNVKQEDRELRLGSLDFALLLLWWVYLYIYSVIPWQYAQANEAAYGRNLNFAYLFEKLAFLIALVVLWRRSAGVWRTMYAHWFGATALYSLSSFVANWAIGRGIYYSGSMYDLPLVASMAWMAVPGLLALKTSSQELASGKALPRGVWTARLGMIAVFSLPIFALLAFLNHSIPAPVRDFRLVLTLAAMVLMGGLVSLKQHFLDIELIQLLDSSRRAFQDLQLLQAQLVQSEKLASLGQLVGGAAHELNNPLTAMLGYSELLSTTNLSSEQRALSDKILHQAKRIRALVASLLSFAKQVPATKSPVDINVVVQSALKLCQSQLQTANVECRPDLGHALLPVRGDANQLLKVCKHIIQNAAHAMSDQGGGVLKVATRSTPESVTIEFSDTGPGISEPAKVFDPFYTTRPVGQGSGLGLSMCYGIIQEHGGRITCRNRDPRGACFLVELPAVPAADSEKPQAQAHAVKL
jgi:signal transduction histidine kinase